MKQYRLNLTIIGLLAALALGTVQAEVHASGYTFTTVDVPAIDVGDSYLTGINLLGQASGTSMTTTADGLVYFQGQYSLFSDPMAVGHGSGTFAQGISDDGFVTGFYNTEYGQTHGYLLTGGTFQAINPPNGYDIGCYGVNNMGDVIGNYGDNTLIKQVGYLYRHGTFTTINDPASEITEALGVNDFDQVVGAYLYTTPIENGSYGTTNGYFYDHGTYTDIAFPGSIGTLAHAINDLGEIVGTYSGDSGYDQGFVYQNGTYTTLNVPGAASTTPTGVNQLGVIVGTYRDTNFVTHSFIATPT